jgi:hypothetical protein
MKDNLTAEELRSLLDYDPATGVFLWRTTRQGVRLTRKLLAGSLDRHDGYRNIRVNHTVYRAARLAWLYVYGHWPSDLVDHINGVRDDDRIENLREASNTENQHNAKRSARNKTGFKGVFLWNGKYRANIRVNGKRIFLGAFVTGEEAHAAYCAAAEIHHGRFMRVD